ncbi:transmembrane protein, putative [Medicago truncatula]|uniref:Transmembrane protein, putative n=1 Tax=Medicago truncatula TaxID=3880 RepID=G7L2Q7_MEDTR|nr:transmembrane protein, putative [Medicago truncatula]
MEGVVVQNGTQVLPGSSWANNQFTRYEKDQGNRMEQMRGSLMVVATVMASLTFQIAINPPGGVWQSKAEHALRYEMFILLCTISFSASQTIIVLLICGFPLRNKFVMWLLMIVTCLSVLMILDPRVGSFYYHITLCYLYFWGVLIVLLILIFFCRFVFWLLKMFFRFLCCY